jgi:hypothetical protein
MYLMLENVYILLKNKFLYSKCFFWVISYFCYWHLISYCRHCTSKMDCDGCDSFAGAVEA